MKKILLSTSLLVFLFACTKQETNPKSSSLTGKWALSLALTNASNGNGFCATAKEGKTIEFFNDGKVVANNSLCLTDNNQQSQATYDNTFIYPSDCQNVKLEYAIEAEVLTVTYPCIEGYVEKYTLTSE
ncbi:hypothetical protein BKI52_07285 [marine bacterium AO1-C]|nr:hypothetical protein BKI52_07285 [marine bacterium AO1-C]